jgi:hypothetical protein
MPDNPVLTKLLEFNFQFLGTMASVCMLWWASSVVFTASILSTIWLKAEEIRRSPWLNWFGAVITCLFLSMLVFGGWTIFATYQIQQETATILARLGEKQNHGLPLFRAMIAGISIGTTSFFFALLVWLKMWMTLRQPAPAGEAGTSAELPRGTYDAPANPAS